MLEMPYDLFLDHIKWKSKLEEEKKKRMDDHMREMRAKTNAKKAKLNRPKARRL
jgi:hypothetical protein